LRGPALTSAYRIAPGPFQSRIGRQLLAVHLSLAASGHRMSLAVKSPQSRSPTQHGGSYGKLRPLTLAAGQNPLASLLTPGTPKTVVPPRRRRELSKIWARSRFPWLSPIPAPSHSSSRTPRHRLRIDTCLPSAHARCLAASSGLLATPVLYGRTEPPGRLRSSTGSPYEPHRTRSLECSVSVGLTRIAPGPFQSQVGQSREQARAPGLKPLQFGLTASWTYV